MKAVLDACVLYPTVTRGLLLDAASLGIYTPIWSERILTEWTLAAGKETPEVLVAAEKALLRTHWPDATVPVRPETEADLSLPDPDDVHVLAAAMDAKADLILTFNLKDFPARTLARHGVAVSHPDPFLLSALQEKPTDMKKAVKDRLAPLIAEDVTLRSVLKRARLPRLGKALANQWPS